jgi:hypothetical protein
MFRQKRSDTTVGSIEDTYKVHLNARRDMLLGNLLFTRGFTSQSQLLSAYWGNATSHATKRRVFISFDWDDVRQVNGFRLMIANPRVEVDMTDMSLQSAVRSGNTSYVRLCIKEKIRRASIVLCLIGNATAYSDWVKWELQTAYEMGKGLCGVRLKDSRARVPQLLLDLDAPVVHWGVEQTIAAIECAAARRS